MAKIVLKNAIGEAEIHETNSVLIPDAETGEKVLFTEGDLEDITVDLNMADGNQVIEAPDGIFYKKITITKPDTLIPANIAKDVVVGGVVGINEGGGSIECDFDFTDTNLRYFDYRPDMAAKVVYIYEIFYPLIYADNGNYDVTIPNTLGGYLPILVVEEVV